MLYQLTGTKLEFSEGLNLGERARKCRWRYRANEHSSLSRERSFVASAPLDTSLALPRQRTFELVLGEILRRVRSSGHVAGAFSASD